MAAGDTVKKVARVVTKPSAKRHILFLIPTLTGGGAERVIITLLRHFDRSKFRLSLAVVDTRDAAFLGQVPDDVEFIDLNCKRVRYAVPKIIALIWRLRPDVVFTTLGHLNLALAMVRSLLPNNISYIARETTIVSIGLSAYRMSGLWSYLYRRYYHRFDWVVSQSQYMQRDLVDKFQLPAKKSVVINNPVDVKSIGNLVTEALAAPNLDANATLLVAAGRMSHEKGFDLLIEAIAALANPRIHLFLLGDGPLVSELQSLAQRRGLVPQVHFVGFQSNPYPWFAKADAFVLSSRYEGFPNVVLEALACGTPVIANPAPGGTREILEKIPGCILAEEISSDALAKSIYAWMCGKRGRVDPSFVHPYLCPVIVSRYEELLK
jgi:glycosyltransferase involved in cell wall biosynthesis